MSSDLSTMCPNNRIIFDESLFRREDDLLNVFRNVNVEDYSHDNFNSWKPVDDYDRTLSFNDSSKPSNSQAYPFTDLDEFDWFNNACKTANISNDVRELQQDMSQFNGEMDHYSIEIKLANLASHKECVFVTTPGKDSFTNSIALSTADHTELAKIRGLKSHRDSWAIFSAKKRDSLVRKPKNGKEKVFSRRKDVIVKTLLRKCRKFFLKEFKRRHVKTLYYELQKYVQTAFLADVTRNNVEDEKWIETRQANEKKLVLFLAVFLYPKYVETHMDLFVSDEWSQKDIRELVSRIHEILYKYSHQKFHIFSKNEQFKNVFELFDKLGSMELRQDREYAAGFEIINGQL